VNIPNAGQVHVATDALRGEAGIWDAQATTMAGLQPKLAGLSLTRVQAGIFQVVFDAYAQLLQHVTDRTSEGAQSMRDVGTTLHQVADTYDREEATHVHAFKHLY
jgi:hypothetical protein